jgi:hypothetical protein
MNDDAHLIRAALGRRFARAVVPACPTGAWRATVTEPGALRRRGRAFRRFAYGAALLAVIAIAGLTAQASDTIKLSYASLMGRFFASSTPLAPRIHRADRLTIAQAQRRMPFTIVVPSGLPAGTRFLYAHVISEHPTPRVALSYEAALSGRYYWISIGESTRAVDQTRTHLEVRTRDGAKKVWTLPPARRWKHGGVVMDLFAPGLPPEMTEHIVRASTK